MCDRQKKIQVKSNFNKYHDNKISHDEVKIDWLEMDGPDRKNVSSSGHQPPVHFQNGETMYNHLPKDSHITTLCSSLLGLIDQLGR